MWLARDGNGTYVLFIDKPSWDEINEVFDFDDSYLREFCAKQFHKATKGPRLKPGETREIKGKFTYEFKEGK